MSDVDRSVLVGFENHLALLPQEIGEDPRFDVRLYTSDGEKQREDKRIAFLAQSIERDGQLDDCLVVPAPGAGEGGKAEGNGHHPKYVMVAGHRRRKAITLLNDRKTTQGQPLIRLRCRVLDPGDAVVRKCAASNIQRTDLSPMHKARLFERARVEEGWGEGPKADKKGGKRQTELVGMDELARGIRTGLTAAVRAGEDLAVHGCVEVVKVKGVKFVRLTDKMWGDLEKGWG